MTEKDETTAVGASSSSFVISETLPTSPQSESSAGAASSVGNNIRASSQQGSVQVKLIPPLPRIVYTKTTG